VDGVWVLYTKRVQLASAEQVLVLILDILVLLPGIGFPANVLLQEIPVMPIQIALHAMPSQLVDGGSILNHSPEIILIFARLVASMVLLP